MSANFIKAIINWISRSKLSVLGGIILSVLTPVLLVSIFFDIQGNVQNPYFGFLIYLILGPLFILGIIFLLIGSFVSRGKEDIGLFTFEYLEEQFNRPGRYSRIRRHLLLTVSITLFTLFLVGLVSYTGFHYTESTAFCGQFCHQVMEPAYSTYKNSPHSQISCVECHIGKSSQWLVRAKFSGAKQLLAVMTDSYPRPIPQPVTTLRPERETCEQCHRPAMFHGDKLYIKNRFLPDESNTHVQTALLMRVGSGGYKGMKAHGIHWHVSEDHQISYRHTDEKQEKITQILLHNDGKEIIFNKKDANSPLSKSKQGQVRKMDCMDCHNRPTHVFKSPDQALDEKMVTGVISPSIPFIKKKSLEVITQKHASSEIAMLTISRTLKEWYSENYPDFIQQQGNKALLDSAIQGAQEAYTENVFHDMNVTWGTYKDFIGHQDGTGCFRCHNEDFESDTGQIITNECDTCHIILAENEPASHVLRLLKNTQ
ncbi:MAG: NapC/NirT family cytochrome c [Desulfobulbaceae bacterium]|nr:NapC/NirT family cytochrome c [Desulfobulbaceae bacterium]